MLSAQENRHESILIRSRRGSRASLLVITNSPARSSVPPSLVVGEVPGWRIGPSDLSKDLAPLHDSFKILYSTPRGTPPSSRPLDPSEMSSKHMVEDLDSLRQYLNLGSMLLLRHSNRGSIALVYTQQYPSRVKKLLLLNYKLQGLDELATYIEFVMKRDHNPIYGAALERLQKFKADRDEEMQERLTAYCRSTLLVQLNLRRRCWR